MVNMTSNMVKISDIVLRDSDDMEKSIPMLQVGTNIYHVDKGDTIKYFVTDSKYGMGEYCDMAFRMSYKKENHIVFSILAIILICKDNIKREIVPSRIVGLKKQNHAQWIEFN